MRTNKLATNHSNYIMVVVNLKYFKVVVNLEECVMEAQEKVKCLECPKFIQCDITKMNDAACNLYPRYDRTYDCYCLRNNKPFTRDL